MPNININVNVADSVYIRNPVETELGKKIIQHSIRLFNDIGFEEFNFKKLAQAMDSTEASVYRYFENKYMLLSYLVAWYWDFMHFLLIMDSRNIDDPSIRLNKMISTLINSLDNSNVPSYIDDLLLHNLVVENAYRVYQNKRVDDLLKLGFYKNYQKLVTTLKNVILEIKSDFPYPASVATTIIDMSLHNEYNIIHFPDVTDLVSDQSKSPRENTADMIKYLVSKLLYS